MPKSESKTKEQSAGKEHFQTTDSEAAFAYLAGKEAQSLSVADAPWSEIIAFRKFLAGFIQPTDKIPLCEGIKKIIAAWPGVSPSDEIIARAADIIFERETPEGYFTDIDEAEAQAGSVSSAASAAEESGSSELNEEAEKLVRALQERSVDPKNFPQNFLSSGFTPVEIKLRESAPSLEEIPSGTAKALYKKSKASASAEGEGLPEKVLIFVGGGAGGGVGHSGVGGNFNALYLRFVDVILKALEKTHPELPITCIFIPAEQFTPPTPFVECLGHSVSALRTVMEGLVDAKTGDLICEVLPQNTVVSSGGSGMMTLLYAFLEQALEDFRKNPDQALKMPAWAPINGFANIQGTRTTPNEDADENLSRDGAILAMLRVMFFGHKDKDQPEHRCGTLNPNLNFFTYLADVLAKLASSHELKAFINSLKDTVLAGSTATHDYIGADILQVWESFETELGIQTSPKLKQETGRLHNDIFFNPEKYASELADFLDKVWKHQYEKHESLKRAPEAAAGAAGKWRKTEKEKPQEAEMGTSSTGASAAFSSLPPLPKPEEELTPMEGVTLPHEP